MDECLSSIKGYVDEIVIVDTGSTDKSLQIAERHGARLYLFQWIDDFSAARNEALKRAKGEWILSIDADELLRPIPFADMRQLLKDPNKIAYYTFLSPEEGWTEMKMLRLFRNHPVVRYKGKFHEAIWAGIQQRIAAGDGEIGESGIVFDHRGFEGDQTAKDKRNIPLLRNELERDPESTWNRQHLANIYFESGRKDEAETMWRENIRLMKKKEKMAPRDSLSYIGLIQRVLLDDRDACALLKEAFDYFPENPQLYWLQGKALMSRHQYMEAVPYFGRLIQWGMTKDYDRSISYDGRIFHAYAYEALALCHFRVGDFQASRRYFDLAGRYEPHSMEYTVKARLCAVLEATGKRHTEDH